MTFRLPIVLAASASIALTGCGGGSSKTDSTAHSPTPAPTPLALAQGKKIAAAGILSTADLPGYAAKPATPDASDDEADAQVATCTGTPKQTYLTRNGGLEFTKGSREVDSSADVASTAEMAAASLTEFTGSKGPSCFESVFKSLIEKEGATIVSFSAKPTPVTIAGADQAFLFKLDIKAKAGTQTVELHGFESGALVARQVEISVSTLDSATETFTQSETTDLLTTATQRAKAATG